jgi:molybdopterin molybdotransferase
MPEFLQLVQPEQALRRLMDNLSANPVGETVESVQALGRVTAAPVVAPYTLPPFPRSTVDGYAVRAVDTYGTSEGLPAYLSVIGEVPMGAASGLALALSECALIHTGGMLPDGSDAVVMVEYTQTTRPGEVEILRAVAVGENVIKVGEDVIAGEEVISAGSRLRPAEIGGLMALGITRLSVARKPDVGIISSGDEVVLPGADLLPGQVRDVNTYTLSALVEESGGRPVQYGIVPDKTDELYAVASRALAECDMLVITAGSSASARDLTAQVINQLGHPGALVHGVNIRPGKPTILAVCGNKAVIGLPGNPVSALVIAGLFVVPVVEALLGLRRARPHPSVLARLAVNVPSQAGREDWVAVRLVRATGGSLSGGRYEAEPIFGKSNLIFTLVRADGLVRVPADATGLSAGQVVEVWLS